MFNKSLNHVTLLGRIGHDPDLRKTKNGNSMCTAKLATTNSYKNRHGEWFEETEWHSLVFWNKLADIAGQYLKKGSFVFVEGRLKTNIDEKEDIKRYFTDVQVKTLLMLDNKHTEYPDE